MDLPHQFPPSMLAYPEPVDFDYNAFLQPQDDFGFHSHHHHHHHHHSPALGSPAQPRQMSVQLGVPTPTAAFSDSSLNKATPPSSDNNNNSIRGMSQELVRQTPAQKRLERRGHTKSRRGCYNCKRRRIKCQETHPACGHCVKTGLKCEYPSLPQITHQPHHQIPLFSLQDMRFFQHFLTHCYPHHPLKQEEVWTHEVPCIAHNHEFLMHAILGFAASELLSTDSSLVAAAMDHRIKAIKAIKKRLAEASKTNTSHEEANALVATCYALTFQSVSLDDGMAEYMTFIRGIVIVGMQMMFKGIKPIFETMFEDQQDELLGPYMETLPLIERGWADSAVEAIENLRPLCVEPLEADYQARLLEIAQKLHVNSYDAYKQSSQHWAWWMFLPHNSFQELINPSNQVIFLLHTHWLALTETMVMISQHEYMVHDKDQSQSTSQENIDAGFTRWLKYLNARVDYEHQIYNRWPMWVEEQLDRDITFFGRMR